MRRRQLKWLWARLKKLAEMDVSRESVVRRAGRLSTAGILQLDIFLIMFCICATFIRINERSKGFRCGRSLRARG